MPHRKYPIVVVGAGISGLALGHFLDRAGLDVLVLESQARPGGVIETRRCNGHVLELGAQRTRLTSSLRALVDSLALSDEVLTAPALPLYVFACGKLREVPLDLRSMLRTDLLSWPDRLRALCEPLTRGISDDESTADFFIRKFGRTAYDRLLGPLFGDLYGSDPADMPARHALGSYMRTLRIEGSLLRFMWRGLRKRDNAPSCTFRNGLQTLTDAMADRLGDRVRTSTSVRQIYKNGSSLRVVTDTDEFPAGHVVLTCPAAAASGMLSPLAPEAADMLAHLRYNALALVHLESQMRLGGMGYQVTFSAGYATRGVTCHDALFGRRGVYTAFLGGATRPDVSGLHDDELGPLAAQEFEAITGAEAAPLAVHRTRMPAWDVSWDVMDGFRLTEAVSVCANWRGRSGITGRIGEAAALAGRLAAEA